MSEAKAEMVEEMFDDMMDIGNEIEESNDTIQWIRDNYAKKGKGMSVAIEVTLKPATERRPNPKIIYKGCFTMMNGYPKKIPVPPDPHAKLKTDFMALRYIFRGYRYYKAPNGKIKRNYGFRKAWAENRLHKEIRDDVNFLSDTALVDKVIALLENRILPVFRKRWKDRWLMQDS